jgi:hypothetical protein
MLAGCVHYNQRVAIGSADNLQLNSRPNCRWSSRVHRFQGIVRFNPERIISGVFDSSLSLSLALPQLSAINTRLSLI